MKFASLSLRYKLFAVILATTLVALLVAGGAMLYYDLSTYRQSWISDIQTQAELLGRTLAPALKSGDPKTGRETLNLLRIRPRVAAAAVYNARGKLFATYTRSEGEAQFPKLPGEVGIHVQGTNLVAYKRVIQNDEILGTVYLRADYELYDRVLGYLGIIAVIILAALLVAGLLSLWLQSVITRPISSIAGIAREVVHKRNYAQRAEKLTDDEVGTLVDSFNNMLDEIQQRTRALEKTNRELEGEIEERRRAREQVLQLNEELEQRVRERTNQLEIINQELESFCYSVSHDLRAPLRAIDGFGQALTDELDGELPDNARRYLERISSATRRMGRLIDDLLHLSRVSRKELEIQKVDLTGIAEEVVAELHAQDPDRKIDVSVWPAMEAEGDPSLLRVLLTNLIGNSWKFTSTREKPRIEFGLMRDGNRTVFFVRDNGVGFDMAYLDKLFTPFQRLHTVDEFPGTGIGLATVQRIISRHGGDIWVDAARERGCRVYFTLAAGTETGDREYDEARTYRMN